MHLSSFGCIWLIVGFTFAIPVKEQRGTRDGGGDFTGSGKQNDWYEDGRQALDRALQLDASRVRTRAQNIIVFLGDGMGISTVTASRIYNAQEYDLDREEAYLAWDRLDVAALSMTYNTDYLSPDSSATATSLLSGEKVKYGTMGVNQHVSRGNCTAQQGNELTSAFHRSMDKGMWTGIVTNTRVTHATPGSAYAHAADRNWEAEAPSPCRDIAVQLIEDRLNQDIRVILGGGRKNLLPNTTADPEHPELMGLRPDGRNLLEEWQANMESLGIASENTALVMNQTDFANVDTDTVERLFGIFEYDHMNYEGDRQGDTWGEPSLTEMLETAIKILSRSAEGYFLLVEGGLIDTAHHDNKAYYALSETVQMSTAVQRALDMTDREDTLLVVTADHSHVFTVGGDATVDTDIFGYDPDNMIADDGKPYPVLFYANGPGYYTHRTENGSLDEEIPRKDVTGMEHLFGNKNYIHDSAVPKQPETHSAEEVGIYSRGPWAHLFHSTHEQSYIAHVLMYAACIDSEEYDHCQPAASDDAQQITPLFTLLAIAFAGNLAMNRQ